MKRLFKQLGIALILVLTLILFSACKKIDYKGKEYKIFYMDGSTILDLAPNSYKSGESIALANYDKIGFEGWYDNKELSGKAYISTSESDYGNLVFYAKIVESRYNIHYYYGDRELTFEVNSYVQGVITTLPKYELAGYNFEGWYLNSDFSGDKVSVINKNTVGDINLYAKMEKNDNLADLLNFDKLNVTMKVQAVGSRGPSPTVVDIKHNGTLWSFEDDNYDDPFYYDEETGRAYAKDVNEYREYWQASENENLYGLIESYIGSVLFENIQASAFEKKDGTFVCKDPAKQGNAIFGDDGTTYTSIVINYSDGVITSINVVASYRSGFSIFSTKYNITFTFHYDDFDIEIPEYLEKEICGIDFNKESINVKVGTSIEKIYDMFTISLVDTYGGSTNISKNDENLEISNNIDINTVGTYEIVIGYVGSSFTDTLAVNVIENTSPKVDDDTLVLEDVIKTLGKEDDTVYGIQRGLSSNSNVLVVPVEFTNYKFNANIKSVLNTAFFGTSEQTGWESLQSYYYKSSYGMVNLTGTVLDVYNTKMTSTTFDNQYQQDCSDYDDYNDVDVICDLIKNILEYYDDSINYKDYDTDGDGYIDSIYLVYSCPYDDEDANSVFWAFSYEYYTDDYEYYDEVEADFYTFLSYKFFEDPLESGEKVNVNAETIIHESGHLFGLTDYYDYDDTQGEDGGIGGSDMMDYNVGDHNAFSKAILGWISPTVYVASDISSLTIDLNAFEDSGESIIICSSWNGTYFDEYYIIDYYTPTGLYEMEAGTNGLFTISGIRIYHVNATLLDPEDAWDVWDIYKSDNSYTSKKLIKLIQADGLDEIEKRNLYSDNDDLFVAGDSYSKFTLYSGLNMGITLTVNSLSKDSANITLSKTSK